MNQTAPSSSAVRVAEFRARHVRLDVSIAPQTGATIDDLAEQFDCSRSVVVRSLLRYALTNRNWESMGLLWGER